MRMDARFRKEGYAGFVAALVVAGACGGEPPMRIVTEPVLHVEEGAAPVSGELGAAAIDYAVSVLGGDLSGDDLQVLSVRAGGDGLRHVRLQQVHQGVPVRSSEIAVHADDSTFLSLNGTVTRHLGGFDVTPAVAADRALSIAQDDHAARVQLAADQIRRDRETTRLVIVPGDPSGASLAWQVELLVRQQPGVAPGRWHYLIDAGSGGVLRAFDALATAAAQASGEGGNPKKARTWVSELDVEEGGEGYLMETDRMITYDLEGGTETPDEAVTGPSLDGFGDAPINDAHGYTEITLDMLRDWMGFDSIDGVGYVIKSQVHYGEMYDNAHWDGEYVAYGDGGGIFYPASGSLDVVAHEMSHGFTEFHSGLIYDDMSGGLNESFSDIAGVIAEFYEEGAAGDWSFGEDTWIEDRADRYLCDPPMDGASLEHANDFDDGVDVHYSSGIPNKAFCLTVARLVAAGASDTDALRRAGQVWFNANAFYWTSGATFVQGCQGTVDAGRSLGFSNEELVALTQSWEDVGVSCSSGSLACNDDGTCDVDGGETCFSCSGDCGACSEDCGWFKKAKCKIGIGDCSRCDVDPDCGDDGCEAGCGDGVCAEDETDESCAQDCGCSARPGPEDQCGGVAPFGCFCDEDCSSSGDCCADIDVCN